MRVLCDVHLSYRLVNRLREFGVDATHVNRILDGSETTASAISAFVEQTAGAIVAPFRFKKLRYLSF